MPSAKISGTFEGSFERLLGEGIVIGRAVEADVRIDDSRISRSHCRLEPVPEGWVVADLGSSNGTFVGGKRIKRALLRAQDEIRLADAATLKLVLDPVPDHAFRCIACMRSVSLKTIAPTEVLEISTPFVCPRCRSERDYTDQDRQAIRLLAADGFEVLTKCSQDGRVALYRSRRTKDGLSVTIRAFLDASTAPAKKLARFREETKAVAKLEHPHIARVLDVRRSTDLVYLVLECVVGTTLNQELQRLGRMGRRGACLIGHQIASALQHAHERQVLHRNVNPHTVLATETGRALLTDFALAKNLWDPRSITQDGETLGNIAYIAPEQVGASSRVDHRADIYGLGATLFHCLAGRAPHAARSDAERHASRLEEPDRLLIREGVDPHLAAVIAQALAHNPEKRFASARAFAEALEVIDTACRNGFDPLEATQAVWPSPDAPTPEPNSRRG